MAIDLDKGGFAEEQLASHFRSSGFFALRGLPYIHDGEDVTDIDVWLYEKGSGFQRRRIIVDAKNKKRAKVAERLLWVSGLRQALKVDAAIVAASGFREAARVLARRVSVGLIDVSKVSVIDRDDNISKRISSEEIFSSLAKIERARNDKNWRGQISEVLLCLLTRFGAGSANVSLRAFAFYCTQSLKAAPNSEAAIIAMRLAYLCASCAAVSLDFIASQGGDQTQEHRVREISEAIRYGNNPDETKASVQRTAELVRQFLHNGPALATQLQDSISKAYRDVPAEIIGELTPAMMEQGDLFAAARDLENRCFSVKIAGYSNLSATEKSVVGMFLDFYGIERTEFSKVYTQSVGANADNRTPEEAQLALLSLEASPVARRTKKRTSKK